MTDLKKRLQHLTKIKRQLVNKIIVSQLKSQAELKTDCEYEISRPQPIDWSRKPTFNSIQNQYDVVIVGGGLAGLTLAIQLKNELPNIQILVCEKGTYPAPDAIHKIGESTFEIGAYYLTKVIGVEDHLKMYQIQKYGARFFYTSGLNESIGERLELGPVSPLPVKTYQIDRGRFENALVDRLMDAKIDIVDSCSLVDVSFKKPYHEIVLKSYQNRKIVKARWFVDAAGRRGLLRRKLGLKKKSDHKVNSSWFRIATPIDIDQWCDDDNWQTRVPLGFRQYSTNHLMGRGYWIWLIRLASGSTSVGLVADPRVHPLNEFNTLEKLLNWMRVHEPQCWQYVKEKKDTIQDFCALKNLAYDCKKVFSEERWCMTGEAALFTDPLYSQGTDIISVYNTQITDLIVRDFDGQELAGVIECYNRFKDITYELAISFYHDHYLIMGNAQVMMLNFAWDTCIYWGILGFVLIQRCYTDLKFLSEIHEDFLWIIRLNKRMKQFFVQWNDVVGDVSPPLSFVDYTRIEFLSNLHCAMVEHFDFGKTCMHIRENIYRMEVLANAFYDFFLNGSPQKSIDNPMKDLDVPPNSKMISKQRKEEIERETLEGVSLLFFKEKHIPVGLKI